MCHMGHGIGPLKNGGLIKKNKIVVLLNRGYKMRNCEL
jgi:hypothetical protein